MPSRDKYTDPELRDEVKEEIHQGDKGGAPGQWSARKAQMMASEYKKRGGGYTTDKKDKDESQQHLDNWTEEEWQTKEGSGRAKHEDGTEQRYLPKKAWEQMSQKEKDETDEKKQRGSKQGQQYVENTSKAKDARKQASQDGQEAKEKDGEEGSPQDCVHHWEKDAHIRDGKTEYQKFKKEQRQPERDTMEEDQEEGQEAEEHDRDDDGQRTQPKDNADVEKPQGKKRGKGANQNGTNKKQKKDIAEDGRQGAAGDKTRVPKKGQTVRWKTIQGLVEGEVIEVVYEEKTVGGKAAKGSKEDPRVVLKSSSSGKIAVHKPEAVYFD